MKVGELKAEVQERGSSAEGKKGELQKELFSMLGGTTRLPALLHKSGASVEELNLKCLCSKKQVCFIRLFMSLCTHICR